MVNGLQACVSYFYYDDYKQIQGKQSTSSDILAYIQCFKKLDNYQMHCIYILTHFAKVDFIEYTTKWNIRLWKIKYFIEKKITLIK